MLSRFRSPKEIKQSLEEIAAGKVDIIIGTHRLLSKDVDYRRSRDCSIVDEEQRFGVRHKERLKELKKNVDVLTMSATPIPAHAAHVAARAARHVDHRDSAEGPAVDPHRRGALRRGADQERPSSRS